MIDDLNRLVADGAVLVLSGAGISTDSGIPDYRGPTSVPRSPMTYQAFVSAPKNRQRYWARSFVGWRRIATAAPNRSHAAVADLERAGLVEAVITQNVDGLHQAAGSSRVVDLHGALDRTICLDCGEVGSRVELDARLAQANPGFGADVLTVNPDGDVDLPDGLVAGFTVVPCQGCGGIIKPDVVFFGENVPKARVQECFDLLDSARALLVLGSSLTVFSGLRFVRRAASIGIPVAIVNDGPTRGDGFAAVRVDARLGDVLPRLCADLVTTQAR